MHSYEPLFAFFFLFVATTIAIPSRDFPKLGNYDTDLSMVYTNHLPDAPTEQTFNLTNAFGEKVMCVRHVPEKHPKPKITAEELTKILEKADCAIFHSNDWWSYSLCPLKTVKQFHADEDQTLYREYILGVDQKNLRESKEEIGSYIADYDQGTLCDITKKPRSVQVRYYCDREYRTTKYVLLVGIHEETSCNYTAYAHVSQLCDQSHGTTFCKVISPSENKVVRELAHKARIHFTETKN